ncbi:hypothetical protein DC522_01110 [Microvirga sp. KLBC 81]|uniref:DUF3806 domain-containing protein n=1 Tax=Microvirga sp. KLBC 81 TaxID=1862707 RepID=UPI000D513F94|nr:DUF3806 domain-containing protein [Microvirga sp. KLBC 81]PVE26390.1 hypothetical protein DC522_01110 [Microvirga sp. KLBC 81]
MTNQSLYQPLWSTHATLLADRRARLARLLSPVSIEGAQRLLDHGAVADDAFEDQEALGVLIGDELIRIAGFEWATIDDSYGSEPVVAHPHKIAVIAPLSAVTNRFEDGDIPFDIQAFIQEALAIVKDVDAKDRSSLG